jgi:hypothetical protein
LPSVDAPPPAAVIELKTESLPLFPSFESGPETGLPPLVATETGYVPGLSVIADPAPGTPEMLCSPPPAPPPPPCLEDPLPPDATTRYSTGLDPPEHMSEPLLVNTWYVYPFPGEFLNPPDAENVDTGLTASVPLRKKSSKNDCVGLVERAPIL